MILSNNLGFTSLFLSGTVCPPYQPHGVNCEASAAPSSSSNQIWTLIFFPFKIIFNSGKTQKIIYHLNHLGFLGGSMVKNLTASAGDTGDLGLIPGWGRSPGAGNGTPLQYSCLENSMDRGAWQSTVHGVAKELAMTKHTHAHMQ